MADPGRIPQIQEFSVTTPPGWSPRNASWYPFRLFLQKLQLWWKITTATEAQAGPLLAARLQDKPC